MNLIGLGLCAVVFSSFTFGFVMRGFSVQKIYKDEELRKKNCLDSHAIYNSKRIPKKEDKGSPSQLWIYTPDNYVTIRYFIYYCVKPESVDGFEWIEFVPNKGCNKNFHHIKCDGAKSGESE